MTTLNPLVVATATPDLGLPYEVQHYILAMMQRILEQGCFDFAARWIPSTLRQKNWTCFELVEISAWRDFLPTAPMPQHALSLPQSQYGTSRSRTLELHLIDAVKIRNSAVHRHLCDNRELKLMATKAEGLLAVLGDSVRGEKFVRLRGELEIWDRSEEDNTGARRARLEGVLREIGEQDLEGMDWTPNVQSLLEIKNDLQDVHADADSYVDEMDID